MYRAKVVLSTSAIQQIELSQNITVCNCINWQVNIPKQHHHNKTSSTVETAFYNHPLVQQKPVLKGRWSVKHLSCSKFTEKVVPSLHKPTTRYVMNSTVVPYSGTFMCKLVLCVQIWWSLVVFGRWSPTTETFLYRVIHARNFGHKKQAVSDHRDHKSSFNCTSVYGSTFCSSLNLSCTCRCLPIIILQMYSIHVHTHTVLVQLSNSK